MCRSNRYRIHSWFFAFRYSHPSFRSIPRVCSSQSHPPTIGVHPLARTPSISFLFHDIRNEKMSEQRYNGTTRCNSQSFVRQRGAAGKCVNPPNWVSIWRRKAIQCDSRKRLGLGWKVCRMSVGWFYQRSRKKWGQSSHTENNRSSCTFLLYREWSSKLSYFSQWRWGIPILGVKRCPWSALDRYS